MDFSLITNILFPPQCLSCRRAVHGGALCAQCMDTISLSPTLFCGSCEKRLPGRGKTCHPEASYVFGAAGSYENKPLKDLIHGLKFNFIKSAAEPIGDILAAAILKLPMDVRRYTITPLPLSKRRERLRGFNQSALIAKRCGRLTDIPVVEDLIVRTKHRKPQSATTDSRERKQNIRGCFAPFAPAAAAGKNIILIDDVTTSGATFLEAAAALRSAGAKKIIAFAAAKA